MKHSIVKPSRTKKRGDGLREKAHPHVQTTVAYLTLNKRVFTGET